MSEWSWETMELRLKHRFTIAHRTSDFRTNVILRGSLTDRLVWGEAAPNPRYGEDAQTTQNAFELLTEQDITADDPKLWWSQIAQTTEGSFAAKAALDMALYDDWGKRIGESVRRRLGLPASPENGLPLCMTIGMDDVETVKMKVKEAEPFPILKIKLGSNQDRVLIQAIRSVTDKPLRIDANEGWANREQALREIEWLATQGVQFIEQPLPARQVEDAIWLKQRSPLPLMADESLKTHHDLGEISQGFHGVNIKLMKCGGISPALNLIHEARALDLRIMLGCMIETSIGIAAAAQLATLVDDLDLDGNLLISNDPFVGHPVINGHLHLNENPGLGVHIAP